MLNYQDVGQKAINEQESIATVKPPTIALLHCYDLIEDFLDTIGVSLETFYSEFTGSWMFGYINALKSVGVRTVLFCISARVTETSRFTHVPTGATICILPASRIYRAYRTVRSLRRQTLNLDEEFSPAANDHNTRPSLLTPFKNAVSSLGTYLSTPLGLLARELRHEGCDAILCQEYGYARFDSCVLLGQLMHLPVFATFQGGGYGARSFLEYPLRLLALRACTGLIIATQTEFQRVSAQYEVPNAKLARIFNPMDVETWRATNRGEARLALGIPLNARVVVWHGRVDIFIKGLDILLAAWKQICDERPGKDLRLLLVGTGRDADKLRQHITTMQLQGVIWLDEFVHDRSIIGRYLSAADVYTLSSRNEGFPTAPIEAMSCGLPVVAVDVNGVPDILEGGEASGGLVVPREDARALALTLGRVLDDEAWGRELGKRARCRAENYFSSEAVGKQLRDFLLRQKV